MSNPDTRSMRFHHSNAARRFLLQLVIVWTAALFALGPSMMSAHETDQYTLPVGREFADLGPHFSAAVYEAIVQAVDRTNAAIKWSLRHSNQPKETDRLQSTEMISGEVWIERRGERIWTRAVASGESEMSHSLRNIEHHHFKFDAHRRPGDVHVHFFGAHSLSFGEGITLEDGDVIGIRFDGFGRPLRNTVRVEPAGDRPVDVRPLG